MSKVSTIFILFAVGAIWSVFIIGCCEETYKIIGSRDVILFSRDTSKHYVIGDTVNYSFEIEWILDVDVTDNLRDDLSLLNSAYATQCGRRELNEIIDSSFSFTCNKAFMFDGRIIDPGNQVHLVDSIDFKFNISSRFIFLDFNKKFLERCKFPLDNYKFLFAANTSDGLQLKVEIDIILNF